MMIDERANDGCMMYDLVRLVVYSFSSSACVHSESDLGGLATARPRGPTGKFPGIPVGQSATGLKE
mgnify:CR=1 FL=1